MTRILKYCLAVAAASMLAPICSAETRDRAGTADKNGSMQSLPDGEVLRWRGYGAWLIDPTRLYRHGVLGNAIEAGGGVRTPQGRVAVYRLDSSAVFEDCRVRLADLDGDGVPEAVVIKSYLQRGAAVAIFRLKGDRIRPLTEGPAIGRANRWLNIAGIADFKGDGIPDVAYVQTPHLAGIVRVFTLRNGSLHEIGRKAGYTNHRIGSRDLDLARVVPGSAAGARLHIPVIGTNAMAVLGFRNGRIVELSRSQN
jgi:hypothetical protein